MRFMRSHLSQMNPLRLLNENKCLDGKYACTVRGGRSASVYQDEIQSLLTNYYIALQVLGEHIMVRLRGLFDGRQLAVAEGNPLQGEWHRFTQTAHALSLNGLHDFSILNQHSN